MSTGEKIRVYLRAKPKKRNSKTDSDSSSQWSSYTTSTDAPSLEIEKQPKEAVVANGYEKCNSNDRDLQYNPQTGEVWMRKKLFPFDGVIGEGMLQQDVYETIGVPALSAYLEGFNATIFAYGQTGSGKTYTIFGKNFDASNQEIDPNLYGLVPRVILQLFDVLTESKHIKKYYVSVSCVEIYNVNICNEIKKKCYMCCYKSCSFFFWSQTTLRDLIAPDNSKNLKIRENHELKKFYVENLKSEYLQSKEEATFRLKKIQMHREVSSTVMNECSSRSHVLLQFQLIQESDTLQLNVQITDSKKKMKTLAGESKDSVLSFVDLAGSEMVSKSKTEGVQLKEAGYINSSLTVLSRVIEALGMSHSGVTFNALGSPIAASASVDHHNNDTNNPKKPPSFSVHVPFRDSSLTKLLKQALGGNCKTFLIVCVASEARHRVKQDKRTFKKKKYRANFITKLTSLHVALFEETYSSLRFAARAAYIKNLPVINKALDAQELLRENQQLKKQIENLTEMLKDHPINEILGNKEKQIELKDDEIQELKTMLDELHLQISTLKNVREKEKELKQQNGEDKDMQQIIQNHLQQINDLEMNLAREKNETKQLHRKLVELEMSQMQIITAKFQTERDSIQKDLELEIAKLKDENEKLEQQVTDAAIKPWTKGLYSLFIFPSKNESPFYVLHRTILDLLA
ncbi:Kinesin motor domain containing protein [Reticulomyxa filosa]|uniref:Kinesin-like protein n=1 Tax=Reticulomyxa filosa TaxID=46433 RepID=X6NC93_RETFI|nr:Kinesin motor domain containing protein [Reticulomyxa filosa]|eukprot:ETO23523.1 Kinesin motor domain containing protein [Reticulomyxa filosa]